MANKAVGFLYGDGVWYSGSILTNPSDGAVLLDTGPLQKGEYLVALTGASSVDWVYDIQHRNATNTGNNDSQRRRPAKGNDDFFFPSKLSIATDERIRLVLVGTIAGEVQHSIFLAEVG